MFRIRKKLVLYLMVPGMILTYSELNALNLIFRDSLTDGGSMGEVHGGTFYEQGWKADNDKEYIYYKLPEGTTEGQVEFEVIGIEMMMPGDARKHVWAVYDRFIDPESGGKYFENNSNSIVLRIWYNDRDKNKQGDARFRIRGPEINKTQRDSKLQWDKTKWYKIKIIWTPTTISWHRNGTLIASLDYPETKTSFTHLFLNVPNYVDMCGIKNATFRNVVILSNRE